jgi:hypothetical protein
MVTQARWRVWGMTAMRLVAAGFQFARQRRTPVAPDIAAASRAKADQLRSASIRGPRASRSKADRTGCGAVQGASRHKHNELPSKRKRASGVVPVRIGMVRDFFEPVGKNNTPRLEGRGVLMIWCSRRRERRGGASVLRDVCCSEFGCVHGRSPSVLRRGATSRSSAVWSA